MQEAIATPPATETAPLVWIKAQIPKPLRAELTKLRAQSVIDGDKDLSFDEVLIQVLEKGLSA